MLTALFESSKACVTAPRGTASSESTLRTEIHHSQTHGGDEKTPACQGLNGASEERRRFSVLYQRSSFCSRGTHLEDGDTNCPRGCLLSSDTGETSAVTSHVN